MSKVNVNKKDKSKMEKDEIIAREIMEWLVSLIVAVSLVLVIYNYVGHMIRVDGQSMEPTLFDAERVWVSKMSYKEIDDIERGDVVITKYPNSPHRYVKRVIGLPGDTIEIVDGELYINDTHFDEPYIKEHMRTNFTPETVQEGYLFVMGDNRNNSRDSRSSSVGQLEYEKISGKVLYVTWPKARWHEVEHIDYSMLEE